MAWMTWFLLWWKLHMACCVSEKNKIITCWLPTMLQLTIDMHLQRNELETKAQYLFFKCSGVEVTRFQRNYYSNKVQTLDKCDVMLFAGVKILFRVGLVLLKCTLGSQEKLKACQGLYETMELLRAIQPQYIQESFLVHEVHLYFCHKDVV